MGKIFTSKQQPSWHFASKTDTAAEYNHLITLLNQFVVLNSSIKISSQVRGNSAELGPAYTGCSIKTSMTQGFRHDPKWLTKILPKIGYPQGKHHYPGFQGKSWVNRVKLHFTTVIANLVDKRHCKRLGIIQ